MWCREKGYDCRLGVELAFLHQEKKTMLGLVHSLPLMDQSSPGDIFVPREHEGKLP